MRYNVFTSLRAASDFIDSIAGLGTSCQGSSFCLTFFSGLDYHADVISEFWEVLNEGNSTYMAGVPISGTQLYKLGNCPWIACQPLPKEGAICLFCRKMRPAKV